LPLIVPSSKAWVYPLVVLNLLLLVLSAMKVVSRLKGPRAVADRMALKLRSAG
jgi:hypothetical protein